MTSTLDAFDNFVKEYAEDRESLDAMVTLDSRPNDGPLVALLPQFSTSPPPQFQTHPSAGHVYYRVTAKEMGRRSAVDLVMADRHQGSMLSHWEPGTPRVRFWAYVSDVPSKRVTVDIFLHRDVLPGVTPQLSTYDTAARGLVNLYDDPGREDDRLRMREEIIALPSGTASARLPHVPRYPEMLAHAYQTLGWDPADFRGYRLYVQYPFHVAQYMIGFKLPS